MPDNGPNGWNQWARHVLAELERLDKNVTELDEKLDAIKLELVQFKSKMNYKASMWGAITGAIPAIIGLIWMFQKLGEGG